jgi:DNA-binding FadR family transcriptional regulator
MSTTRKPRGKPATQACQDKSLRLHGMIARDLGVQIVSGRYKPGDILKGEIEADRLRVSRTTYREAMRTLAAKGLVQSRTRVGTRVSPQSRWDMLDPDVLSWFFEFEPDDSLLDSLFELRKMLEPHAAALAALRRSQEDLNVMARALDAMARHTLAVEAGRTADQEFHSALLRAARNPFLVSLIGSVSAAVARTTIFQQRHSPLPRDPVPDHARVYAAVAAADSKGAYAAMSDLIDLARIDTEKSRPSKRKRAASTLPAGT